MTEPVHEVWLPRFRRGASLAGLGFLTLAGLGLAGVMTGRSWLALAALGGLVLLCGGLIYWAGAWLRQADGERRQALDQLSTRSQAVEATADYVIITDAEGRIEYVNRALLQRTGFSLGELLGETPRVFKSGQHHPHFYAKLWHAIRSGDTFQAAFINRTKTGELYYEDKTIDPILDEAGRITHFVATGRDVTERKQMEQARQRAEDEIRRLNLELEERVQERTGQLEAANRELEAFSYSVSHDLRAPLRAVDGFAQILLQDFGHQLDAEGRRVLSIVCEQAARMGHLIDDMLALSHLGRRPLVRETIDITALVRRTFDDLLRAEPGREVQFQLQPLPPAVGDPGMIRQLVTNLISNALKYTRKQRAAAIEVGTERCKGQVVYFVKDNGVGFNMEYSAKLFRAFQRLHSEREFDGHGVGLALVQRIITRHGGRVWGEGRPNEGATFYFTLPEPR